MAKSNKAKELTLILKDIVGIEETFESGINTILTLKCIVRNEAKWKAIETFSKHLNDILNDRFSRMEDITKEIRKKRKQQQIEELKIQLSKAQEELDNM